MWRGGGAILKWRNGRKKKCKGYSVKEIRIDMGNYLITLKSPTMPQIFGCCWTFFYMYNRRGKVKEIKLIMKNGG